MADPSAATQLVVPTPATTSPATTSATVEAPAGYPGWALLVSGIDSVAWPAIALLAVFILRVPLRDLLGRIKRVGSDGAEFHEPRASNQASAPPALMPAAAPQPAPMRNALPAPNPVVLVAPADQAVVGPERYDPGPHPELPPHYLQWREQVKVNMETAARQQNRPLLGVLLDEAAGAVVAMRNERIYREIFGSQIRLLQLLNSEPSIDIAKAKALYDVAKAGNPDAYNGFPFDRWLAFHMGWKLIEVLGQQVSITLDGRAFLSFISDNKLSMVKPL